MIWQAHFGVSIHRTVKRSSRTPVTTVLSAMAMKAVEMSISKPVDKEDMKHTFGLTKEGGRPVTRSSMDLEAIRSSEISQLQKDGYCTSPLR